MTRIETLTTQADLTPLATKLGLAEMKADLIKWMAGMLIVVVGLTLTGIGTATAVILNRLAASTITAPAPHASLHEPALLGAAAAYVVRR